MFRLSRINLHTHTTNSDGGNNIIELSQAAKRLGHSALVITDHDSEITDGYLGSFSECRTLRECGLLDMPVIVGAEVMTPFGEYLLFGSSVLKRWVRYKKSLDTIKRNFDASLWVDVFKKRILTSNNFSLYRGITKAEKRGTYPYALIMCHPRFDEYYLDALPQEWIELIDGFEVVNGLEDFEFSRPKTIKSLRRTMPWAKEFKNSDAHSADCLSQCHNETDKEITDEISLINYIREKRNDYTRSENQKLQQSLFLLGD